MPDSYDGRRALTEKAAIPIVRVTFLRQNSWYAHCSATHHGPFWRCVKPLAVLEAGDYSGTNTHVFASSASCSSRRCCFTVGEHCAACVRGRAFKRQIAGGIRHQGRAERPLERGHVSVGESRGSRSHVCGRLE